MDTLEIVGWCFLSFALFSLFLILLFGCCLIIKVRRVADLKWQLALSNRERRVKWRLHQLEWLQF